jgi:uncharacterized membrane protein (UPF0127 family)
LTRTHLIALAFLCLSFLPQGPARADGSSDLPIETVVIATPKGQTAFKAEIADTSERRSKGLMFRDSMAQDHGMLFDFGEPRPVAMWMKNTKIPLDMIFADKHGRVISIAEDSVPFSTDTIAVNEPVKAVFEVNAGTARRIGLKPGGRLIHPMFKGGG